jgi:hypothetical protein
MADAWEDELNYQEEALRKPKPNGGIQPGVKLITKRQMLEKFTPPDWLARGIAQRRFIYSLTGQTGHAKTAIALLFAKLVATGQPLGPHDVKAGRVAYLVGENPDDVTMRLIGSDSLRDDKAIDDEIYFIRGTLNISENFDAIRNEIGKIGGVDLLIVDTSAAYFQFPEENNNAQIGAHGRTLRRLTELPGEPCVLVLCHPVKYVTEVEQLVPRGGGAFLAEMDGNMTVRRTGDNVVELHHSSKFRGPGFEPLNFRLDRILTEDLVDTDGIQVPTVHAVYISAQDVEAEAGRTRSDDDQVLAAVLKDPGISVASIAEKCGWTFGDGRPAKSRAQRALERLAKEGFAKLVRGSYVLSEKGKDEARKVVLNHD